MKKKFTVIVTLLLAFVLCFALVACGGDTDGGDNKKPKAPTKKEVIDKAVSSLDEYFDSDVFGGVVSYDVHTKKYAGLQDTFEFVKKNNSVFYKAGEGIGMFDVGTNMNYVKTENGWMYDGEKLPQGTFEYVYAVLAELAKDDAATVADESFPYDAFEYSAKAGTLTAEVKLAEDVNRPLRPLQATYEEGSIKDLLDEYLEEYHDDITAMFPELKMLGSRITVDKIAAMLDTALIMVKNQNLIETLESFVGNDIGAKFDEFLKGAELTDEALADAKARTIGQAVEGALKFIEQNIDLKALAAGDYSSVLAMIDTLINGSKEESAAIVNELLQDLIFAKVDMSDYDKDVVSFTNTVVDILKGIKIKPIVDSMESLKIPGMSSTVDVVFAVAGPAIKEIIAKPVEFKALDATLTLTLTADYSVGKIELAAVASHDYEEETALPILSDNDYSASVALELGGTSEELNITDMSFVKFSTETDVVLDAGGNAIINLDTTKEQYVYYLETRMLSDYTVDGISVVTQNADGEDEELVAEKIADYDKELSSFVLDREAIEKAVAGKIQKGARSIKLTVKATVHVGETLNYDVTISVYAAVDAKEDSATELVTAIVGDLFGFDVTQPNIPGANVPSVSAA